ncbi:hypothetical protein AVEN_254027-1 [Araneus ventricosus]|uniref:RNase H type-1 domain-containing protein n=1 Tax=Araneus ventricosus TaxID=182803 RepID=A0A4Y2E862_ARAVE|nr:hypothetical protein AVEN_254027-1 [Araneus ventricosus]
MVESLKGICLEIAYVLYIKCSILGAHFRELLTKQREFSEEKGFYDSVFIAGGLEYSREHAKTIFTKIKTTPESHLLRKAKKAGLLSNERKTSQIFLFLHRHSNKWVQFCLAFSRGSRISQPSFCLSSRASCYTRGLSWASKTNQQIKVWSDSEPSLHSIASIETKSPIAQQTQEILLKSTNIKLGWIKGHVGYSGNEAADVLAKKATQEGIPAFIPAPRNHIKSLLQKESIIRWQKECDNGETGRSVHNVLPKLKTTPIPWQRPEIMFATDHGPFPTYLKRFNIRSRDPCGCGNLGNPLHYATSACLQHHTI